MGTRPRDTEASYGSTKLWAGQGSNLRLTHYEGPGKGAIWL